MRAPEFAVKPRRLSWYQRRSRRLQVARWAHPLGCTCRECPEQLPAPPNRRTIQIALAIAVAINAFMIALIATGVW